MKNINSALENYLPVNLTKGHLFIEGVLRRGSVTIFQTLRLIDEMVCQDCGGCYGHTCWDGGKRVWFCGNQDCLFTDSAITKAIAEKKRQKEFLRRIRMAAKQKASKEWDGQ